MQPLMFTLVYDIFECCKCKYDCFMNLRIEFEFDCEMLMLSWCCTFCFLDAQLRLFSLLMTFQLFMYLSGKFKEKLIEQIHTLNCSITLNLPSNDFN